MIVTTHGSVPIEPVEPKETNSLTTVAVNIANTSQRV
jgi:hypothetical protein